MTDETPDTPVARGDVFTHSTTIAKLAAALAQAQLNYGELKATQVADAERYKYNYADLASVLQAVRPALAKSGIALLQGVSMQKPLTGGGLIVLVETRLVHSSGEWIATTLRLPTPEVLPQKIGSLVSYLRRYGLLAVSGVAAEDDDASSVTPSAPVKSKPVRGGEPSPSLADLADRAERDLTARAKKARLENELPPSVKAKPGPKPVDAARHQPIAGPDTITPADRGLLFKTAKGAGVSERQVKSLIFALWGYTSTSQIRSGLEFTKVLSALEHPADHGVAYEDDDVVYTRENDPNALPQDVGL